MNYNKKGHREALQLLNWLQKHPYPHCRSLTSLAALRTGVALAEVLTSTLPKQYHSLFLPLIEIYNLTRERSILNLRVILDCLHQVSLEHPQLNLSVEEFSPEGLYFDHNMMEEFVAEIIYPLNLCKQDNPIPDISDIANLSSIIPEKEGNEKGRQSLDHREINEKRKEKKGELQEIRIAGMCQWLLQNHHIQVEDNLPEQIIGNLVNSVFAGSRLDRQIVKSSHFKQGACSVFKKVGEFLLSYERMPKQNVLALLDEIESGCVREELFWNIIEDIMNLKSCRMMSKRKNQRKSLDRLSTQGQSNKENGQAMINYQTYQQKQNKKQEVYECNADTVAAAEHWIRQELGYEHSLLKSQSAEKVTENPLLNGVLLGSIIMRMQLGKVNINKEPRNLKEVDKNMSEVTNCIIRRGIDSGRKFTKYLPTYSTYLGIIFQVKNELQNKHSIEKNKRAQIHKDKQQRSKIITSQDKEDIQDWIKSKGYQFETLTIVPSSLVSEICGEILELRLLRETTQKIRENNMAKILEEFRRLGWEGEGDGEKAIKVEGNELRWSMLQFGLQLTKFKVHYCR